MARTPSLTPAGAEAILGPRGSFNIRANPDSRATVKKWLTAQGYNALFVAGLSGIELQNAYNNEKGMDAINRKWSKAKAEGVLEAAGAEIPLPLDAPAPDRQNAPLPFPAPMQGIPASPSPAVGDPAQMLRDLILGGWTPPTTIDADQVRGIVQEQLAGIAPRVIHIRHDNKPDPIRIEGYVHPEFERALKYLKGGANVMLVGPAGCGKTHMARQLAKALDVLFGMISGSAGATESEIKGWLLPADGGRFEYAPSDFVKLYEGGNALYCFDEIDGFDPNMLMVCNVPLANGHMHVQQRRENPTVTRGENVYFLATANTFGTGANPLYVGRNPMDEATRDRFIFITVDYDRRLEESIGAAGGLTAAEMAGIWELRDRCREAQLRRVISTRAFQKAAIMKQAGDSWREIRDRLVEGWTRDEKAKVGA